jgi:NAD(P)-dependent dehydrogenase (short-subunit alcohol dehydrogenase family)
VVAPQGKLDGRTVLISGVARGQGRSHAVRCAAEGANLVGFDLCEDIESVPYPLATAEDLAETEKLVREAGIFCGAGPQGKTPGAWYDTIDVNLTGAFHTLEAVVPTIIEAHRGGSIVITSSGAGLKAMIVSRSATMNGYFSYTASKHALVGLMKAYALSLAAENIRVNSIHPTGVDTPMATGQVVWDYLTQNAAVSLFRNAMPVEVIAPSDVTDAVLWLLSDEARYVTGTALPIDAGSNLM